MKTINKSELFKRAWSMYKSYMNIDKETWTLINSFGKCLKRAWAAEKVKVDRINNPKKVNYAPYYAGAEACYHGDGSQGRYFGD